MFFVSSDGTIIIFILNLRKKYLQNESICGNIKNMKWILWTLCYGVSPWWSFFTDTTFGYAQFATQATTVLLKGSCGNSTVVAWFAEVS